MNVILEKNFSSQTFLYLKNIIVYTQKSRVKLYP